MIIVTNAPILHVVLSFHKTLYMMNAASAERYFNTKTFSITSTLPRLQHKCTHNKVYVHLNGLHCDAVADLHWFHSLKCTICVPVLTLNPAPLHLHPPLTTTGCQQPCQHLSSSTTLILFPFAPSIALRHIFHWIMLC